jgi:hypothetical protein
MLHVCRLTDPSITGGKKGKANLTVQNLYELIEDVKLKAKILQLIDASLLKSDFCRDWRNRHLAHRDLDLALGQAAVELPKVTIDQINSALNALAEVLNAVQLHYFDGTTAYDFASPPHGAQSLLYLLEAGLKARDAEMEQLKRMIGKQA